jgi:hypothetical protein
METAVRHEVEVDSKLAELYARLTKANHDLDVNKLTLARYAEVKPRHVTRTRREVTETTAELLRMIEGKLEADKFMLYEVDQVKQTVARHEALLAERESIIEQRRPLNDEFDAKRWSRFFLVTSSAGGHIHSSMSCPTTRITTGFGWLPELSGLTERDAVEAHGTILCSVCYPTAPVAWTLGHEKPVDPDRCSGSGTYDVAEGTYRRMGLGGNGRGKCTHCGEFQTVTSTGKLRAHKREGV